MFSSRPQSMPAVAVGGSSGTPQRKSLAHRLSVQMGIGAAAAREPFTVEEARSTAATDIALRIGNKDPSLPCMDDRKYTPLHIAAGLGNEEVAKMILSKDHSCVNAIARLGLTPLIVAVSNRQWRIVHVLVAAGADLALVDASKRTAYDIAVEEKAPETILQILFPMKKQQGRLGKAQPTPFSSIVVNESSVTVNLRDGDV